VNVSVRNIKGVEETSTQTPSSLPIPDIPSYTPPMRQILTSMVLVVLMFPALALGETVTFEDLVITDGLYYKKFSDVPFTGKVTGKTQGSFRKGKKHGPLVDYHDNGQLWIKGTYKNGKMDGPWVRYYDNGQLFSQGTYKDGKMDGPWEGYNEDGTVWRIFTGTYKNGAKVW